MSPAYIAALSAFAFTLILQVVLQQRLTFTFALRGLLAAGLVLLFYWIRERLARRRVSEPKLK